MPDIIERPPEPDQPLPPLWQRLAWFVGLAVLGAGATMLVAYALRAMLK
jgi:hypothetical protein